MSKSSRKRRRTDSKSTTKNPMIYYSIFGIVLTLFAVFFLISTRPEPGSVVVEDGRPTWQTLPLVDARTGETFTLASFADKNVFVKIMSPF